MAIFVQSQHQLTGVISNIDLMGSYTGLTLNLSKTIALDPFAKTRWKVAGVEISSLPVKYLGVILGFGDLTENNFAIPLHAARNNIQKWNKRQLTLFAQVVVAKTFIISMFVYIFNSVFVSTD